jgi:hypothetical protein
MKIYGPYFYKTGNQIRRLVIKIADDGTRRTQSYARYLLEEQLGRELGPDEEADHIDEDCLNDDISNLRVLSLRENRMRSAKATPMFEFVCPVCGNESSKPQREVRRNQEVLGKAGPFCSKSCAGVWSTTRLPR